MGHINAKEFLQQAFEYEKIIRAKENRVRSLRENAEKSTSSTTAERVSGTGVRSKVESNILRAMEIEDDIKDLKGKKSEAELHILSLIETLENPIHKEILESRHIDFMGWKDIEKNMQYSHGWTLKIYAIAVERLQKKLDILKQET